VVERVEQAGHVVAKSVGIDVAVGKKITEDEKAKVAEKLCEILFEVLERKDYSPLTAELVIFGPIKYDGPLDEIGFCGGVAEYVYDYDKSDYGDMGPLLGAAVRKRLPSLGLPLAGSSERIRATVIGASQYTVQVSSSTVFVSDPTLLPQLDLQVVPAFLPDDPNELNRETVDQAIALAFEHLDIAQHDLGRQIALALIGPVVPTYDSIKALCDGIADALQPLSDYPWTIMLSADVAGLVGSMLKREHKVEPEVIVVDGITVGDFNFVDLGEAIESVEAIPVVVKSLVFEG
ncbi:MAG: ethanolamine ammonia-lyase reactivating factor EutA, partial [Dehalococcoidia bacterium]